MPQQQQQQQSAPAAQPQQPRASGTPRQQQQQQWRAFQQQHYAKCAHLDTVFYTIHLLMSAVHKRVLVTSREQLGFEVAMAMFAGALLLRLFFRPLYMRVRPQLVLLIHVLVTVIRGFVVSTMATKQAVHARAAMVTEDADTVGILLATMLAVLGGPFRLFEALGLQQSWAAHVGVSLVYLVVHPWAAADGMRMAYTNAMFYLVHAAHDSVAAVVEGLLGLLLGVRMDGEPTCSSCAGVAVYGFVCLYGSVAVPLYILYMREQWAFHCWIKASTPVAPAATAVGVDAGALAGSSSGSSSGSNIGSSSSTRAAAAAAADGPPVLPHGSASSQAAAAAAAACSSRTCPTRLQCGADGMGVGNCEQCQQLRAAAGNSTTMTSADSTAGSGGQLAAVQGRRSRSRHSSRARLEAMCLRAEQVAAEQSAVCRPAMSLGEVMSSSSALARLCVHLSALVCMMMVCWMVSNAFALVLLPRILNSHQLQWWCPNRPLAPFVIAGQVYEGL